MKLWRLELHASTAKAILGNEMETNILIHMMRYHVVVPFRGIPVER